MSLNDDMSDRDEASASDDDLVDEEDINLAGLQQRAAAFIRMKAEAGSNGTNSPSQQPKSETSTTANSPKNVDANDESQQSDAEPSDVDGQKVPEAKSDASEVTADSERDKVSEEVNEKISEEVVKNAEIVEEMQQQADGSKPEETVLTEKVETETKMEVDPPTTVESVNIESSIIESSSIATSNVEKEEAKTLPIKTTEIAEAKTSNAESLEVCDESKPKSPVSVDSAVAASSNNETPPDLKTESAKSEPETQEPEAKVKEEKTTRIKQ